MMDYNLDFDEGILHKGSEFELHRTNEDLVIEELVLTNKNLIYAIERSTLHRFKTLTEIEKVPLDTIKIINNQVMAKRVDHDEYGLCLQIQFLHGVEYWDLTKKEILQWINALNSACLGETAVTEPEMVTKKKRFWGKSTDFVSTHKVEDKIPAQHVHSEKEQPPKEIVTTNAPVDLPPMAQHAHFCSNCGASLGDTAKFCQNCGFPVNGSQPTQNLQTTPPTPSAPTQQPTPIEKTEQVSFRQRRQEYVGTIFKCPNCGSPISKSTAICPECGVKISNTQDEATLRDFREKLMELESKERSDSLFGVFKELGEIFIGGNNAVATLIKNYPIPNTVDEIVEFVIYAKTRFDSCNTRNDKYWAWQLKIKQLYMKAKMSFPNDISFKEIEKIYFEVQKACGEKI